MRYRLIIFLSLVYSRDREARRPRMLILTGHLIAKYLFSFRRRGRESARLHKKWVSHTILISQHVAESWQTSWEGVCIPLFFICQRILFRSFVRRRWIMDWTQERTLFPWQTVCLLLAGQSLIKIEEEKEEEEEERRRRRKKRGRRRSMHERKSFFFALSLCRTVEKWKQNGDIVERKKRAARHFICFSRLFQWHTVSGMVMNIEQQATTAPTNPTNNLLVKSTQLGGCFQALPLVRSRVEEMLFLEDSESGSSLDWEANQNEWARLTHVVRHCRKADSSRC